MTAKKTRNKMSVAVMVVVLVHVLALKLIRALLPLIHLDEEEEIVVAVAVVRGSSFEDIYCSL